MVNDSNMYNLITIENFKDRGGKMLFHGQLVNAVTNEVIPVTMSFDNIVRVQDQLINMMPSIVEVQGATNALSSTNSEMVEQSVAYPSVEKKVSNETSIQPDSESENLIEDSRNKIDDLEDEPLDERKKSVQHVRRSILTVHQTPASLEAQNTLTSNYYSSRMNNDTTDQVQNVEEESADNEGNKNVLSKDSVVESTEDDLNQDDISEKESYTPKTIDPFRNDAITPDTNVLLGDAETDAVIAEMELNDAAEQRKQFGMVAE